MCGCVQGSARTDLLVKVLAVPEDPAGKVLRLLGHFMPEAKARPRRLVPSHHGPVVAAHIEGGLVWELPHHVEVLLVLEDCTRQGRGKGTEGRDRGTGGGAEAQSWRQRCRSTGPQEQVGTGPKGGTKPQGPYVALGERVCSLPCQRASGRLPGTRCCHNGESRALNSSPSQGQCCSLC